MKKKVVLSYLVSAAFILAILYFIDLNVVIPDIVSFGLPAFIALVLFNSTSFILRGLRWQKIVSPLAPISFSESTYITWIGFLGNYVLPVRIGEFIRAFVLSKKKNLGKIRSFSIVVIDRIIDGIIMVIVFAVGLLLSENIPLSLQQVAVIPILLFVFLLIFFVAPRRLLRKFKPLIGLLPWGRKKLTYFIRETSMGSEALRQKPLSQLTIWLLTVLVWLTQVALYIFVAGLMQINLSLGQAFLLTALIGFGVMIPSAPGSIGPYEGAFLLTFAAFGLSLNQAISMAVITHLIQFATIIGGGLFSLNRLKLSYEVLRFKSF